MILQNKTFWYLILLAIIFSFHGAMLGAGAKLFSFVHVLILAVAFGSFVFTYNYFEAELVKAKLEDEG